MHIERLYPAALVNPEVLVQQLTMAVPAGYPNPGQDFATDPLSIVDLLVPNPKTTFFARVAGYSMTGAGIEPGDIAIADRSLEARDGDIVVAVLDGMLTIKRLVRQRGTWALKAENPEYPDVVVDELSELVIWSAIPASVRLHRPLR